MPLTPQPRRCVICNNKLVKNGKTAAGTQRWKCVPCRFTTVRKREDLTQKFQLQQFLTWLTGKQSQQELDGPTQARSFRRKTSWCWNVEPALKPVTVPHHTILVDGIYIGSWCLLIAVTEPLQVLAWQWCARESTPAWAALLSKIPAPTVIVCDGGAGIHSALKQEWPHTQIQRCLFHVRMTLRRHLTMRPRTPAGKHLAEIGRALSQVETIDDAIEWKKLLEIWWQAYGHLTKERTRYRDGTTGYTHDRLRKAWQLLLSLNRKDHLFTYLIHGNGKTTSPLEGGINNGIRTILRNHRGMSETHMKRAAEWHLTLEEIPLTEAHEFINGSPLTTPETETKKPVEDPSRPALYDTGLDATEGLWLRTGWAGRG